MRIGFFIYATVGIWVELFGQVHQIRRFGIADGLPNAMIVTTYEDRLGYLWVGTNGGGLSRYDGKNFLNFETHDGLPSEDIISIQEDELSKLWVITSSGLAFFDGRKFVAVVDSSGKSRKPDPFQFKASRQDLFFTTTDGGLHRIHGGAVHWDFMTLAIQSKLVHVDEDNLFVATSNELQIFNGNNLVQSVQLPFGNLYTCFVKGDTLLLSFANGRLAELINRSDLLVKADKLPGRVEFIDKIDGSLWIAPSTGLIRGVANRDGIELFDIRDANFRVNQISKDREGVYWVSTYGGLFRLSYHPFQKVYGKEGERESMITSISSINKTIWLGTGGEGIHILADNALVDRYKFGGLKDIVRDIQASGPEDSEIYLGTYGGFGYRFSGDKEFRWITTKEGLPSDSAFTILPKKDGVWIGTRGKGLVHWNKQSGKLDRYFLPDSTANYFVWSFLEVTNQLLLMATNKGLFQIADQKVAPVIGFEMDQVFTLSRYKNSSILAGTGSNGLVVYDLDTGVKHTINKSSGLLSDWVFKLAYDSLQDWILNWTDRGLQRVKLSEEGQVLDSEKFNSRNGYEGIEVNLVSVNFNDKFYIGSISGLYEFNDSRKAKDSDNPLHLENVEVYFGDPNYPQPVVSRTQVSHEPQKFHHTQNHITLTFNRIYKFDQDAIQFRYKLDNYDKDWSPASSTNRVTFGNLVPGEYTFLAQATNSAGVWLPDILEYTFVIQTPFYQTGLFYVITVMLFVISIAGVVYWRIRYRVAQTLQFETIRSEEQAKVRKEIARDFHDEMGNQLAQIISYAGLLKFGIDNQDEIVNKIELAAKNLHRGTKDFIWSIDHSNDELLNVFLYIRDFAVKLLDESKVMIRAYTDLEKPVKLPHGHGREVILIFKEVITNCYKYANPDNVTIKLFYTLSGWQLLFSDDGIGFDLDKIPVEGGGINNIKARAEKIGADLEIKSSNGVTVSLIIKTLINGKRYDIIKEKSSHR